MFDNGRAGTRMVSRCWVGDFTTGVRGREPGQPHRLEDGLGVGGGLGNEPGLVPVQFQGDQPHGAERFQGGIQGERQPGSLWPSK